MRFLLPTNAIKTISLPGSNITRHENSDFSGRTKHGNHFDLHLLCWFFIIKLKTNFELQAFCWGGTIPTCQIQTPAFLVFIGNSFDFRTEAIELFYTWAQSIQVWKKYREQTGVNRFFQNSTEIGNNEEKQLKYVYTYAYN